MLTPTGDAHAATKAYVDSMMDQVKADMMKAMEKIACLVIHTTDGDKMSYLKLKVFRDADMDYSLTCSGTVPTNATQYISLVPPPGYAFTGLADTWQSALKIGTEYRSGTLNADGSITFMLNKSDIGQWFTFVSMDGGSSPARFILEVA